MFVAPPSKWIPNTINIENMFTFNLNVNIYDDYLFALLVLAILFEGGSHETLPFWIFLGMLACPNAPLGTEDPELSEFERRPDWSNCGRDHTETHCWGG